MPACTSCKQQIEWRTSKVSGRKMPIDSAPAAGGNIVLVDRNDYKVVPAGEGTHTSHFATCPNAQKHRKRNR